MALPFLRQPGGGEGRSGAGPGYVLLGARFGLLREV